MSFDNIMPRNTWLADYTDRLAAVAGRITGHLGVPVKIGDDVLATMHLVEHAVLNLMVERDELAERCVKLKDRNASLAKNIGDTGVYLVCCHSRLSMEEEE